MTIDGGSSEQSIQVIDMIMKMKKMIIEDFEITFKKSKNSVQKLLLTYTDKSDSLKSIKKALN